MKLLHSCFVKVAVLVLLHFAKIGIEKFDLPVVIYLKFAINTLQMFVLVWFIINIVIWLLFFKREKRFKEITSFLVSICLFSCGELYISYYLDNPALIPKNVLPVFRKTYHETDAHLLTFQPAISVYDTALFYTLHNNSSFLFFNREFNTTVKTNSAGLRDEEENLTQPEIIFLGDSFTMGWGVEQDSAFPQLIAKLLNVKTLNTGIPSYGTARELLMLQRLDTSSLKYIILQYCENDDFENEIFINNNYHLPVSSKEKLQELYKSHNWGVRYFPGKYSSVMLRKFIDWKRYGDAVIEAGFLPKHTAALDTSVSNFLSIVKQLPINKGKVKIMVLHSYPFLTGEDAFINQCEKTSRLNGVRFINVASALTPRDYFLLDTHLNESGHKKVALQVVNAIAEMK